MDCDQQNNFDDGLYQDADKDEGSDRVENSMEETEKMKSSSANYEVGDEGKGNKPAASGMRECEYCGKEFSTGKALGGHKSFHLRKKLREAKKAITYGIKMADGKLGCYLCNKNFATKNSLFGHMRTHPDRLWRGVNPPTVLSDKQGGSSSFNSGSMEDIINIKDFGAVVAPNKPVIDLSKSLPPGWLQTYKRGRECLYCKKIMKAARKLMSLSQGSWQLPQDVNLNEDGLCDGKPLSMDDSVDEKATLLWIVSKRIRSM